MLDLQYFKNKACHQKLNNRYYNYFKVRIHEAKIKYIEDFTRWCEDMNIIFKW